MSGPVDVLAAMDAVESWAREVSDQHIDGEDGLRQAYVQDLRDFRTARAAVAELIEAAKRADKLIRLLTVRQVIEAGDEYIEAAGLNPYCMNEGLAEGGDRVRLMCLEFALANVGGAS
jgi:hypothetical protein